MALEDGPRYWVNDAVGIGASGTVHYGDPSLDIEFTNYVGLVDENYGGMIAYGEYTIMQEIADGLNALEEMTC